MNSKHFFIGMLMCLIAATTWGGLYPILGSALHIMDPFYLTLFRFFIAAFVLIILLFVFEGKEKFRTEGHLLKLWFLGTMGFSSFSFLVFLGQKLAGPSGAIIASVIMAIQPMLGILVNWIYQKVAPKPLTILFMLTGLIGVIMVISKGDLSFFVTKDANVFAYPLIIIGALSFVIYTTVGSSFSEWSPLRFTTLTTMYASVTNIIIVGFATLIGWLKVPTLSMIGDVSGSLLYMSLIAGVLAYFVWNVGNRIIAPINAIFFLNLVPITTFIISVIQGYQLSSFECIGAFITIASLIGNNLYIRKLSMKALTQQNVSTG